MPHKNILFYLLSLILLLLSSGCAYNPGKNYKLPYATKDTRTPTERRAQYELDADNHILRVSRHGYLVPHNFVHEEAEEKPYSRELLARNIHAHMPITEVTKRYKKILINALKLSCKNTKATEGYPLSDKKECETASEQIINKLEENPAKLPQDVLALFQKHFVKSKRPLKLLIYFHGGLNSYKNTDERMQEQLPFIKAGVRHDPKLTSQPEPTEQWQYPVYISWPSNAIGSYEEHLFSLREGRRANPIIGAISSPLVLIEDLANSVGEFPSNVYYQATNDKDRFASLTGIGLSRIWTEAFENFDHLQCTGYSPNNEKANRFITKEIGDNITINRSVYSQGGFEHNVKTGVFTIASPIRWTLGSLWNGTVAGNAWKVMKRRARNLFDPTGDSDSRLEDVDFRRKNHEYYPDEPLSQIKKDRAKYQDGIGSSLGSFFESIFYLKQRLNDLNIQITLVGHSMGAIAINNLLEKYQTQWTTSEQLMIKNIVYMAAAASIEETLSIVPDIMRGNPEASFHNLTLNRVSEVAEMSELFNFFWFGLLPSGSLLVSIDKFHDHPEHQLKRTFGSEVNIHSSLPAILKAFEGVTSKITFKAFNDVYRLDKKYRDKGKVPIVRHHPKMHGDFSELAYWLPDTWEIKNDQDLKPEAIECTPVILRPFQDSARPQLNDILFDRKEPPEETKEVSSDR